MLNRTLRVACTQCASPTCHPSLLMMSGLIPKASAVPTYDAAVTTPTAVLWYACGSTSPANAQV